jgi:steroid 5-alpha reductase family enzyme
VSSVSCPEPQFQADFFNNVAAVAIVLIFAKVVAHRSRKGESKTWRRLSHGAAVAAAALATVAALLATEAAKDYRVFHWLAWIGLGVAGTAFVVEILIDDVFPALRRPKPDRTAPLRESGLMKWIS